MRACKALLKFHAVGFPLIQTESCVHVKLCPRIKASHEWLSLHEIRSLQTCKACSCLDSVCQPEDLICFAPSLTLSSHTLKRAHCDILTRLPHVYVLSLLTNSFHIIKYVPCDILARHTHVALSCLLPHAHPIRSHQSPVTFSQAFPSYFVCLLSRIHARSSHLFPRDILARYTSI